MKQIVLAILILVSLGLRPTEAQERQIEAAISGQVAAFKAGDFEAAFAFASPAIRQMFGSARNFEVMVRHGYAVMTDPAEMRFLERRIEKGAVWQRVFYRDPEGGVQLFDYEMVETPGGWRINAVEPVRMPRPSV